MAALKLILSNFELQLEENLHRHESKISSSAAILNSQRGLNDPHFHNVSKLQSLMDLVM